ncbi:hypothetical protein GCM10010531_11150 [Blastococcus jejuensis]|uniref:DUF222 domain-containing protein n=2 Tax=Blastococcus jejuensis TaxID=351224 RepID=A0ABP6NXY9_9ACTN
MIERMTEGSAGDWYAEARRRAVASSRRRRAGAASTEWPEFAPPVALSEGPLGAVQAADREIARLTSVRARAVAEFAESRPATADRAQGEPGAMSAARWAARPDVLRPVSEWAMQELAVALSITAGAAESLLTRSLTLVHRLPGTLAALEAGALHQGHLWPMLEHVAPIADDRVRAEVEAELLRWAAGRITTPAQLGAKARREVTRRDCRAALRRLQRAIAERGVRLRSAATDGMSSVTSDLTVPEAHALYRALGAYADALPDDPDGPVRTRGQKMADCLLDLVLRPGEHDLPPVRVLLTVVASVAGLAGGDEPAEIDGQVVPAEMVRALLRTLAGHRGDQPATDPTGIDDPADSQPPPHRRADAPTAAASDAEPSFVAELADDAELADWWDEMERRVLADELVDPDPEPLPDDQIGAGPIDPLFLAWMADDALHDDPPGRDPDDVARSVAPAAAEPANDPAAAAQRTADLPAAAEGVNGQPVRDGWWAAADRAVEEAGLAALEAARSLGRARQAVRTATAADTADESAWQSGPGGRVSSAVDALDALAAAEETQRAWLAGLLAATGGGGLVDRPRIAVTDALTGALLALTDLPELRRTAHCSRPACTRHPDRCTHDLTGRPGLGPPGPTDGYRPSAPLDRFVRARDRRCRFPGCRRRVPRGGELDHNTRHPLGETSAANLAGYCTTDHRGKHQAPGWRYELDSDGTLTVTTPTGLTVSTDPPPY